ncbi:hypothetical protein BDM02DRAFT_3190855 [Thelephora ganbajun]|uniref:Uncharacterized protein n=1 Tax=Thelephora ganbajun TaxID=370292 RepID=A0ACB6Z3A5_THEGA|nr:hypothetical protein BDM02DRAFT_3190855 [Thelephora ganbajun]
MVSFEVFKLTFSMDDRIRRYLLVAARKDPRYLPVLPTLFANAPDLYPRWREVHSAVPMFYDMLDLEELYAPELREFVNRAIQVDPSGIVPLIPLVLRPNRDISFTEDGSQGAGVAEETHNPAPDTLGADEFVGAGFGIESQGTTNAMAVRTDDKHYELYVAISKKTVRGVAYSFLLGALAVLLLHALELSPIASMIGGSSLSFAFTLSRA